MRSTRGTHRLSCALRHEAWLLASDNRLHHLLGMLPLMCGNGASEKACVRVGAPQGCVLAPCVLSVATVWSTT